MLPCSLTPDSLIFYLLTKPIIAPVSLLFLSSKWPTNQKPKAPFSTLLSYVSRESTFCFLPISSASPLLLLILNSPLFLLKLLTKLSL